MVARLEGVINGKEIIFSRRSGDVWECTFPSSDACEVTVELRAYDEAGNFCYTAKYMLLFDPESLELRLLPLNEWLEKQPEDTWLECICPCDYWLVHLTQEMR